MVLEKVFINTIDTTQYAAIGRTGYGRICETSPFLGLSAFGVSFCVVIIGHCRELKRTVLINTPIYMHVERTLEPIFNWVIAKYEGAYKKENTLDVAIIRGYLHADPAGAQRTKELNYLPFYEQVIQFVQNTYPLNGCFVEDKGKLPQESSGIVFVDKITGRISIAQVLLPTSLACYSEAQLRLEKFSQDVFPFTYISSGLIMKRHLQFDNNKHLIHSRMSDPCRVFLRAKFSLNYNNSQLHTLLCELLDNTIVSEVKFNFLIYASSIVHVLPCELCGEVEIMNCPDCYGAWYCSPEHMRDDRPYHRRFCKSNALKPSQ